MCTSVIATAISDITAMTFLKHWTQKQDKMVCKEKHFLKGWTFWSLETLIAVSVYRNLLQIHTVCIHLYHVIGPTLLLKQPQQLQTY